MKAFKFNEVEKKFKHNQSKQVSEKEGSDNFLKLYEDIPSDPAMDAYCEQMEKKFYQKMFNNRYYCYNVQKDKLKDNIKYRLDSVKKMRNFQLGFKAEAKTMSQISNEQSNNQKEKRRKQLCKKFKWNIKLIIEKLNKMKMKMDDVIKLDIFSKEPYKFGKNIFDAIKQGNQEKVWHILMLNKLAIFSVDNTQKSPLIWASIRGYPEIIKILLQFGSDIHKADINKFDSLYYSIKYDHSECVKVLVLNLAIIGETHQTQSLLAEEKTRNILRLGTNLIKTMKKLEFAKRAQFFEEQYKYFYS